ILIAHFQVVAVDAGFRNPVVLCINGQKDGGVGFPNDLLDLAEDPAGSPHDHLPSKGTITSSQSLGYHTHDTKPASSRATSHAFCSPVVLFRPTFSSAQ